MECNASTNKYTIFFVIINFGIGSKVLNESKMLGVLGGTIFIGRGTANNHILELLGLEEIKKEIVLMVTKDDIEEKLHKFLVEKFNIMKPNNGIVFSLKLNGIFGARTPKGRDTMEVEENTVIMKNNKKYEVIFTIVDRGMAEEVIEAAALKGATGGTIINGRGSSIHENSKFFGMNIEPEKEIVMILIAKHKVEYVIDSIRREVNIDEPGKGIMFSMDVNKASGLFNINIIDK